MAEDYGERTGCPFKGKDRERLVEFLAGQGLQYDENITYSLLLEDQDEIIATGSCYRNVLKCIAISAKYQGRNLLADIMTRLYRHLIEQKILHYFVFTKPENQQIFCDMGLYLVETAGEVILLENQKQGLEKYVKQLVSETGARRQGIIGAVVANCNPFTAGHRYLIEIAARQCDWLHVFILSDYGQTFTAAERYELAEAGVADLSNIILHQASEYMISPAVFPAYFMKEQEKAAAVNCRLDLKIFCTHIAKALAITRRFAGTEPDCQVTAAYNECMRQYLPEYGIAFYEIERLRKNGKPVSASLVRDYLAGGMIEPAMELLPEAVRKRLSVCERSWS